MTMNKNFPRKQSSELIFEVPEIVMCMAQIMSWRPNNHFSQDMRTLRTEKWRRLNSRMKERGRERSSNETYETKMKGEAASFGK